MGARAERQWEPGSFRDPASRVFCRGGAIFRALSASALEDWEKLNSTGLLERLQEAGKVVRTTQVDGGGDAAGEPEEAWGTPESTTCAATNENGWVATLRHEAVPFVSYPYEWSFGMLKDAALLYLEILETALDAGMILKDGSSFNVQWMGARPVFIDIGSFTRLRPGDPWVGYRQFCSLFLFPLLLQAYKDISFQPWLRGSLEGIPATDLQRLMSARDLLRPGILTHVCLQARLEARHGSVRGPAHGGPEDQRTALRRAGFHTGLIQANVGRLKKLIGGLRWQRSISPWADYEEQAPYTEAERTEKAAFVRQVVHMRRWSMVWDLGCNTGHFARIAAEGGATVVAMDSDALVVERFYQALKEEQATGILPLLGNVADPSPNRGWRNAERRSPEARGQPDLILVLALVHHLSVGASIPLREIMAWLAGFRAAVVVEFVERDDPMVRALLRRKDEPYSDYDRAGFERCWSAAFETRRRQVLASGHRTLYYGEPRS